MFFSAGLVTILALLPSGFATGHEDTEKIEECRKIAMRIRPGYVPTIKRGDSIGFFVDKVTSLTDTPEHMELPKQNICSPLSNFKGQKCDTTFYEYTLHADGSRTVRTEAESEIYKDVVEITSTAHLVDTTHYIFRGEFRKMAVYNKENEEPTVIQDHRVPELVKRTQGELYALVERHPDEKWELYARCDGRVSWSVVQKSMDAYLALEELHEQIDAAIRVHGLQRQTCMIETDTKFMFPFAIFRMITITFQ